MSLIEPIFAALNQAQVRYVVVGGLATVLHGYARLTADVDLIVDFDAVQVQKAMAALTDLGFKPRIPVDATAFADRETRTRWIKEKGMRVFSLWDPAQPMREIDLFVEHPIPFDQLWSAAEVKRLATTSVRIASIPHLIYLKRLAGRPQDLQDIKGLEAIQRKRDGSG